MDRDGERVGTKIENHITMLRNRVGTCLHWTHMVCVAHICTEITFSLQLRSIKAPQPAEPRQLMCFCYPVSPAPCLFSFSPMEQIHLCGICPRQRNQPKQSRVIKVYCSINKSSRALLASLNLRVFDDEKQLSVLASENELFENIMVIYLVHLKEKMWVLVCCTHRVKLYQTYKNNGLAKRFIAWCCRRTFKSCFNAIEPLKFPMTP